MLNLPEDIKAEALLNYLTEGTYRVAMCGVHNRNARHDIQGIDETAGKMILGVARKSLYNALPEYLFHPFDSFDQLSGREMRDKFDEALEKQEKEKDTALSFFAPIDLSLLSIHADVFKGIVDSTSGNKVLLDILSDRFSEGQKQNRFIASAFSFLKFARYIRGDITLLTLMIRKVLKKEELDIECISRPVYNEDSNPRYADGIGGMVGDTYAGNAYFENVRVYDVRYWPAAEDEDVFLRFLEEVELFREFLQDYFMSIEECLCFRIINNKDITVLNGTNPVNYLNFNTNL